MKNHFLRTLVLLLLPVSILAQSADEEAIKALVLAETTAFYKKDADAWQVNWLHDAKAASTVIRGGTYGLYLGWEKIEPNAKRLINTGKPRPVEIVNDNFLFRTDSNLAWVQFDQTVSALTGEPKAKSFSREQRVLVKQGGQWKIASAFTVTPDIFGTTPQAIERNLNSDGYKLLRLKKLNEAIDVFNLNVKFFPESWNAYDSLGEAYAEAGNTSLAIQNYEQSVKLNPLNEVGKANLMKLKQK